MEIQIVNKSHHMLPTYATLGASGMDLRAFIQQPLKLAAGNRVLVTTGIYIALPQGYEAQVRPRSGLALHHGITVLNSPGTIDADYRGELKVLLINLSDQSFSVQDGDRIAQLVVTKYESVDWKIVSVLGQTTRGVEGYGSTGQN